MENNEGITIWVDKISDTNSLLDISELNILSLGKLVLGISVVNEVVSLLVSDMWVEIISDSISVLYFNK